MSMLLPDTIHRGESLDDVVSVQPDRQPQQKARIDVVDRAVDGGAYRGEGEIRYDADDLRRSQRSLVAHSAGVAASPGDGSTDRRLRRTEPEAANGRLVQNDR